jgi:hypothetical protein
MFAWRRNERKEVQRLFRHKAVALTVFRSPWMRTGVWECKYSTPSTIPFHYGAMISSSAHYIKMETTLTKLRRSSSDKSSP